MKQMLETAGADEVLSLASTMVNGFQALKIIVRVLK